MKRTVFGSLGAAFACALVLIPPAVFAEIIPSTNRIDWASVAGVEGGIPARPTVYTNLTNIDNTGVANVLNVIQSAINLCPSNQTVRLPAGTFLLSGSLQMKSHVTLRGAGPTTILRSAAPVVFNAGGGKINVNAVSGYTRGSTSITLANAPANLTPGCTILLNELNDRSFVTQCGYETRDVPSCETYLDEPDRGTRIRGQLVRVTSIAGSVVEFTPPLYWSYAAVRSPRIEYPAVLTGNRNMLVYSGLQDLVLDSSSTMVLFENAQNCWLSNVVVRIRAGDTPSVRGFWSHRINIQHCTFVGFDNTASAVVPYVKNEGWLVENNIFSRVNQSFIVVGVGGGHVFAYNFTESITNGTTAMIGEIGNHGGHPQFVLLEGNVLWKFHNDSIHGSSSHWTLFRNQVKGRKPGSTFGHGMIWIDHTNWYNQVVGNVLGYPSIPTSDFGWLYEYQSDGSDNDGPSQIVLYRFGMCGYNQQTVDPRAKSTTLRHGNYDYLRNIVDWDSTISDRSIPNSLYLASKPAWFGNLDWPAIGPDVTGFTKMIPAQYRFIHGIDPPAGPQNQPPLVATTANPRSGVPPLTVTFSSSGSSDPEGAALTYAWVFGDGITSTAANPSHIYQTEGSYVARLTVSDGTNSTVSGDINITVGNQPPVAVASANPTAGAPPLTVTYLSTGSSDPEGASLSYNWQFGDGTTSTAANPSHTYQAAGVFTARLTVSDGVKTATSSDLIIRVGSGLVAAYGFETGSGTNAVDDSGNGNTGGINAATWANGRVGKGLSFNGVNSVITVPHSSSLNLADAVTLEAWVFPTALNGDYQSIITKPVDSAFSGISYVLHGGSRPSSLPSFAIAGMSANLLGTSILPLNTWTHLAGTYDGTTVRLYVNGAQVATRVQSGSISSGNEALRIGMGWSGVIDDVRIYNRALSASEVQRDMNASVGVLRPATPAGFQFVGD